MAGATTGEAPLAVDDTLARTEAGRGRVARAADRGVDRAAGRLLQLVAAVATDRGVGWIVARP